MTEIGTTSAGKGSVMPRRSDKRRGGGETRERAAKRQGGKSQALRLPAASVVTCVTLSRSGNVVYVSSDGYHHLSVGRRFTIDGAEQRAYNGTFAVASIIDRATFTYKVTARAGAPTGSVLLYRHLNDPSERTKTRGIPFNVIPDDRSRWRVTITKRPNGGKDVVTVNDIGQLMSVARCGLRVTTTHHSYARPAPTAARSIGKTGRRGKA